MRALVVAAVAAFLIPSPSIARTDPTSRTGPCSAACHARVKERLRREAVHRRSVRWHRIADPSWGIFQAIAECESHGNWATNTGNGYYGGIQFDLRTWTGVGGRGLPSDASKLEQIMRGVLVVRSRGGDYGAWPVCRRSAGV